MLFSFINEIFYFCINNVVGKPIIKCLFYIFKFIEEDCSLTLEMCFYDSSFITEGAFTLEIEGAGINVGRFLCGGGKSVNIACVY